MHPGMWFGKFYCTRCDTKLETERTHRVVTKGDRDYYQYQSRNKFPQTDYDVYDYRFRCPQCHNGIAYEEQCVLARIQKKQGKHILTREEIARDYAAGKKARKRSVLCQGILLVTAGILLSGVLYGLSQTTENAGNLASFAAFSAIVTVLAVARVVTRHKGQSLLKPGYAYETETLLQKLQAYATYNKNLVAKAEQCHCFRCGTTVESRKVEQYADEGQTALCPNCGVAALLPDSIEEALDERILSEMHEYWF